jgi:hypothetical protein
MIFHAVKKAQADVQCKQRVMPDVAHFAKQALQFLANTAARLQPLQEKGQLPGLFSQVRSQLHEQCTLLVFEIDL